MWLSEHLVIDLSAQSAAILSELDSISFEPFWPAYPHYI